MISNLNTDIFNFIETGAFDYHYGLSLLSKVCKNRTLVNSLQIKESSSNQNKLLYELDKYLISQNYETEEKQEETNTLSTKTSELRTVSKSTTPNKQEVNRKEWGNSISKSNSIDRSHITHNLLLVIEQLKTDRNKLYAERASYHGQLHGANLKDTRFDLAKLIIPIQKKIDGYNNKIEEIQKTGKLPINGDGSSLTVKEHKRLVNLKIYIRRYNNKAKKATDLLDKEKHLSKVKLFETELNEILSLNE